MGIFSEEATTVKVKCPVCKNCSERDPMSSMTSRVFYCKVCKTSFFYDDYSHSRIINSELLDNLCPMVENYLKNK